MITLPHQKVDVKVKRNIRGGNTVKYKALNEELCKFRNWSCF